MTAMPATPTLRRIPLAAIRKSPLNPRTRADEELDGLAASLGGADDSMLAQPPVVEQIAPGDYRLVIGERRLNAAAQAGWPEIDCLAHPALDPLRAHRLRVVENLHRKALHPLDEAAGLRVLWLCANAEAMNLGDEARAVLAGGKPLAECLTALDEMLRAKGFAPKKPPVTWNETLDQVGVSMTSHERKHLLRVLSLDAGAQQAVRGVEITVAGLQAIGTLDGEAQKRLAEEMAADPALARKARSIANNVKTRGYTLDEAIAQAQGRPVVPVVAARDDGANGSGALAASRGVASAPQSNSPGEDAEQKVADVVVAVMNARDQLAAALSGLRDVLGEGGLTGLPEPWGEYAQEAMLSMRAALDGVP